MKILKFRQGHNFISMLLVVLAGYMIYADKSHWGWIIVAAFLLAAIPSSKSENENDE